MGPGWMGLSLAESFHRLPEEERLRLQKLLGVILRQAGSGPRVRVLVDRVYSRLGRPRAVLERLGLMESFVRLLDSFGVLAFEQLHEKEKQQFLKNPYTIRPDAAHCCVCAEAMPLLARDPFFRTQDYLFAGILIMKGTEQKAWLRWLGCLDLPAAPKRAGSLYWQLARLRSMNEPEPARNSITVPVYLNEVFLDDPTRCPVAWFYRDVLPLYAALNELETLHWERLSQQERGLLRMLKDGRLIVRAEKPEFGEATRWRIVETRERITNQALTKVLPEQDEVRNSLF